MTKNGTIYIELTKWSLLTIISPKTYSGGCQSWFGQWFRDTCSWNGQLESPKWNKKDWRWKVRAEVGKFAAKLESSSRSWKVWAEVGKFELKLESSDWSWKLCWILSDFARFFLTLLGPFQLKQKVSNLKLQLLVLSNCPFQLHVSRDFYFLNN